MDFPLPELKNNAYNRPFGIKNNNKSSSNKKEKIFSLKALPSLSLILILSLLLSTFALAIPGTLTLQGKLTDTAGAAKVGNFNFSFKIYDSFTGGNKLWQQDTNITTDSNGIYDIILQNLSALNFSDQYYLGITVSSDNESTPRINLTSSPYSFRANISEDLNPENIYRILGLNITGNLSIGTDVDDIVEITSGNINLSDSGNLVLIGNVTLTDKLTFRLGQFIDNLVNGWLRVEGSLNVTGNVSIAQDTLFVDNTSGRVGIGTSSPISDLHISRATAGDNLRLRIEDTDAIVSGFPGLQIINPRLTWTIQMQANVNDELRILSNDTLVMFLDKNAKVGINTTNPTETLTVVGTLNVTPAGNKGLVVASSGNVGIGTASPQNKLEVIGAVTLAGGVNASSLNVTGFSITDDSLVTLADGTKKKIKDINKGEEVLTLEEKTGKLVLRKVNALLDHGIKPIYEMTTESGRAINTTGEHPYYAKLNNNYLPSSAGSSLLSDLDSLDLDLPSCIDFFLRSINSESSLVLNTFMRDCCLNAVSSDQIAEFNANANAKYGSSSVSPVCGDILLASARNSLYASSGNSSTFFSSNEKINENASSLILPYFFILSFLPDNSLNENLGLTNLDPRAGNSSIIFLLSELLLKKENRMEASTTNVLGSSTGICSPYNACLLAASLLSSEPHSNAISSVISEFFNNSSATLNINLSDSLSLSALDTIAFISSLASSLDPTSSSSEISTFSSGILTSPDSNNENDYLNVSDEQLGEWIEVRYLKVGDEIAVPDYETNTIKWEKIASIKKLPEQQHVYDLAIEGTRNFIANDIVAHNTYLATESGNVGIGTTSPASLLEVDGTFNATSSSTQFLVNANGDVVINLKG